MCQQYSWGPAGSPQTNWRTQLDPQTLTLISVNEKYPTAIICAAMGMPPPPPRTQVRISCGATWLWHRKGKNTVELSLGPSANPALYFSFMAHQLNKLLPTFKVLLMVPSKGPWIRWQGLRQLACHTQYDWNRTHGH